MRIYYNPKLKQLARNLRNNSTLAEVLLWNELKQKRMRGYQFYRQKPILDYIVDFYCSKLDLVIEIDGISHFGKEIEDKEWQTNIENLGIEFLRIPDNEVKGNMDGVYQVIVEWIEDYKSNNN
ncbi:MAG: endonuclease domain-containing protein [Candidatus Marinimicrobia bacterium]|jgi:very-short-patch-repair endonuclease|nr:endonuclease domain-containing protein [Candidatus Neomarinimicrobiota bacterium]MBT3676624.1 endonuclease domain-containing protein [Candidatus Neomarinimicrobiota bacterium]MBT4067243.1 endonuclease domain-containing protein [Candidatus Neomarinimicrobiota bacterium]MBT4269973.1 endonuclease domain-containing protein [Candidatus Neomarinimicrobiota bacterium]MBT7195028.1 endonuclease domain-containing protein [Candidatus Neomarinimicrobiota bacterium]